MPVINKLLNPFGRREGRAAAAAGAELEGPPSRIKKLSKFCRNLKKNIVISLRSKFKAKKI
jgi:hypothetical protein